MNANMTLVGALETIWKEGKGCQLSEAYFEKVSVSIKYVCEMLKVSRVQAYIIAVILDGGRGMSMKEVGSYAGLSLIRMMCYGKEFEELHDRWMLGWIVDRSKIVSTLYYFIRPTLAEAIRKNERFEERDLASYTEYDVIDQVEKWLDIMDCDESLFSRVMDKIIAFLVSTNHLSICWKLLNYELRKNELAILLKAIVALVKDKQESIDASDYDFLLKVGSGGYQLVSDLNEGKSYLNELELLENATDDGLAEPDIFALTQHARMSLLEGINLLQVKSHTVSFARMKNPTDIVAKAMFYNSKEQEQVERLSSLLEQENFLKVQMRLLDAGMRSGFACLLYGCPGSGKTETVLQICKQTERKLFQVDISSIKSKWVGDSEKHIQAVFDQYADVVKQEPICPVLLFNEADAIFAKRNENARGSADQMLNSMQNIILQAMETFTGILICTTNLTQNLDKAFERRFLYKIKFQKPGVEVKRNIWHSMMPALDETSYTELARTYDFSGGEIENVVRKQTIDSILNGTEATYASVCGLCNEERLSERTRVGYN